MLFPQLDKTKLFDSHAHISSVEFKDDTDNVIKNALENNVEYMLDVSVDLEYARRSLELCRKHKGIVYAFVGIDPEVFIPNSHMFLGFDKDSTWFEDQYEESKKLVEENKDLVIGIGESGMDFYHNKQNYKEDRLSHDDLEKSKAMQEKLFRLHLELAQELKLPMTIHSRGAESECLDIAKGYNVSGIFHSFTGNYLEAKNILDSGWGLGVNGIVTFKKADELRNVYKQILGKIPKDVTPEWFYSKGIYFETDSPYLSPEGKRGERNEPGNIKTIYDQFVSLLQS